MTYQEAKKEGLIESLIPVHINKCRCENYFWDWDINISDWVRGREIPEHLKRAYKNPLTKSNYS